MTEADFLKLLEGYKKQTLSGQELQDFLDTLRQPAFESLLADSVKIDLEEKWVEGLAPAQTAEKVWHQLKSLYDETKVRRLFKDWRKIAAVVSILLAGSFAYFIYSRADLKKNNRAVASTVSLAAGNMKAILTTANGQKILLDSAATGIIYKQGNTIVNGSNGQLVYQDNGQSNPVINKVETPTGGQYSIILSDGTKVWLNAGSSLTFPASFDGKDRTVAMTGEAYFEVAQQASRPFKVIVNSATWVDVLGTSFNVNAYQDEESIKTTLIQGAVLMNAGNHTIKLVPGQQAKVSSRDHHIERLNNINIEQVLGWKNGYFTFEEAPVEIIMNHLRRWYNIEVVYKGNKPTDLFTGSIPLSSSLPNALKILEYARVRYVLQGDSVTILSFKK